LAFWPNRRILSKEVSEYISAIEYNKDTSTYAKLINFKFKTYFAFYKSIVGKPVGYRISRTFYNKYGINYRFKILKERHILHLQVQEHNKMT
jgi:hypothetical protein